METRANHVVVGAFTIAVLAAALLFVWWFAGGGQTAERAIYRIQFKGSVSGLTPGSPVHFNGIRVGDVAKLDFDRQDPSRVIVRVEIAKDTPVRTDTRARLEMVGLTGVSTIQLIGVSTTAKSFPLVTTKQGDPDNAPVLLAEGSAFQDILEGARTVLDQAQITFSDIRGLIGNSRGSIERSLQNVEQFTAALAANSDDLKDFMKNTGVAARQIGKLADNLVPLVTDIQNLVKAVDVNKVDKTMSNAVAFSESLKNAGPDVEKAVKQIAGLAEQLRGSGEKVDKVLVSVQGVIDAVEPAKVRSSIDRFEAVLQSVDPEKVASTVDSVRAASADAQRLIASVDGAKINRAIDGFSGLMTSIDGPTINRAVASFDRTLSAIDGDKVRATVDNVNKFAEALGRNSETVDQIIADAKNISGRLTGTADKLDALLDDARKLVGSGEAQGAIADFQKTSQAIRELALKLDGRTAEIASGISRLSSSGQRDIQGFVADSRRTLNNLDAVIGELRRNPRQFLFGNSGGVPEYRAR